MRLCYVLFLLLIVTVTGCGRFWDSISSSGSTQSIVSSWKWIDGDSSSGLNLSPSDTATNPSLATLGSSLYIAYAENDGGNNEARAMVWNGSQSWSSIDGGATTSNINYVGADAAKWPILVAYNSKLYSIFGENMGSGYMTRAKVWSGSGGTWNAADSNVSPYLSYSSIIDSVVAGIFNGQLYATFLENDNALNTRVIQFNSGTSWSFVDGDNANGINDIGTSYADSFTPSQLVSFNNKLYAAWAEGTAGGGYTARVSVYNGGSWSRVDGGVDGIISYTTNQPSLGISLQSFNGKLYIAWAESNGTAQLVHVDVYNGNDSSPAWSSVDNSSGNENVNTSMNATSTHLLAVGSYLYMAWCEDNTGSGDYQVRVDVYDGNDSSPKWTSVDGGGSDGLNFNPANTSNCNISFINWNNVPYIAWDENNGSGNYQIHVRMGQ